MAVRAPNPAKLLARDIVKYKWVLLLLLLVVGSAIGVVFMSHQNRQLSIELEQLLQQKDDMDVEWRFLLLEQGHLAEHSRVEQVAKDKLKMHRQKPEQEIVVSIE
jgi:cell division protein FtsL